MIAATADGGKLAGSVLEQSVPALHRPVGGDQAFVATDEGADILVTHLLRRIASQRGTKTAAAIHDDLSVFVRVKFLQIALQNAFSQMHSLGGVAGHPLIILPHIKQHRLRIGGESGASFGDADFGDAAFGIVDEGEKSGRVIHGRRLRRAWNRAKHFRDQ